MDAQKLFLAIIPDIKAKVIHTSVVCVLTHLQVEKVVNMYKKVLIRFPNKILKKTNMKKLLLLAVVAAGLAGMMQSCKPDSPDGGSTGAALTVAKNNVLWSFITLLHGVVLAVFTRCPNLRNWLLPTILRISYL